MTMRTIRVAATMAASLSCAGVAFAASDYENTGQELARFAAAYERVQASGVHANPDEMQGTAYYQGFTMCVAVSTLQALWCPSARFTGAQVAGIVARFLANSPESWGEAPERLVVTALARVYPCNGRAPRH